MPDCVHVPHAECVHPVAQDMELEEFQALEQQIKKDVIGAAAGPGPKPGTATSAGPASRAAAPSRQPAHAPSGTGHAPSGTGAAAAEAYSDAWASHRHASWASLDDIEDSKVCSAGLG